MTGAVRIIETVGPPGSGKTTLAHALQACGGRFEVTIFPYFRQPEYAPFFARSLAKLSPTLATLWRNKNGSWLSGKDLALMAILTGWDAHLERLADRGDKIILLEEGAICLLAKLYGFGAAILKEGCAAEWWETAYRRWAETLDLVIALDIPSRMALERIRSRSRDQQYEFVGMPDADACSYLDAIQRAQAHVLQAVEAAPGSPKILHFDALEKSPQQIANEIMAWV